MLLGAHYTTEGAYFLTELIYSRSWNLGPKQLVYNGELEGLVKATEVLSTIANSGASIKVFLG